jgi:hypothetical protein
MIYDEPNFFVENFIFPDELHTKNLKKCPTILAVKVLIMFSHQKQKPLPLEIYQTIAPSLTNLMCDFAGDNVLKPKAKINKFSQVKAHIVMRGYPSCTRVDFPGSRIKTNKCVIHSMGFIGRQQRITV